MDAMILRDKDAAGVPPLPRQSGAVRNTVSLPTSDAEIVLNMFLPTPWGRIRPSLRRPSKSIRPGSAGQHWLIDMHASALTRFDHDRRAVGQHEHHNPPAAVRAHADALLADLTAWESHGADVRLDQQALGHLEQCACLSAGGL